MPNQQINLGDDQLITNSLIGLFVDPNNSNLNFPDLLLVETEMRSGIYTYPNTNNPNNTIINTQAGTFEVQDGVFTI